MKIPFIKEKEVFEVNPDLEANVHVVGPEEIRVVVIDNFYKNPDMVRDLTLSIPPTENSKIMAGTPGTRVFGHYDFETLYPIFRHVFRNVYTELTKDVSDDQIYESVRTTPFCVNINQSVNLPPVTPHIDDRDSMLFAAGIYLNTPEECSGGTSFYMLNGKQTITNEDIGQWLKSQGREKFWDHYITDTDDVPDWELLSVAEMKYNRLVMYPGNVVHTAYMKPDTFTGDLYRLIQMMFIALDP
jgi:elongation factor P hydroxylase